MRISYEEFRSYIHDIQMKAANLPAHFPKQSEPDTAACWRTMDKECTGYIELRDWDLRSHENVAEFKLWADRRAQEQGEHARKRAPMKHTS